MGTDYGFAHYGRQRTVVRISDKLLHAVRKNAHAGTRENREIPYFADFSHSKYLSTSDRVRTRMPAFLACTRSPAEFRVKPYRMQRCDFSSFARKNAKTLCYALETVFRGSSQFPSAVWRIKTDLHPKQQNSLPQAEHFSGINMNKWYRFLTVKLFAVLLTVSPARPSFAAPQPALSSGIQALFAAYPALLPTLGAYADSQGFRGPYERISTIAHELIHIDSAAHGAYRIHGQSFDPYNAPRAWPAYRLSQFRDAVARTPPTATAITNTAVFAFYVINAPDNTLASLADELNAYGQSTEWLCAATPSSEERSKSTQSMLDMLRVTNAFLMTLRTKEPSQHAALYMQQKPARNLLALTALNALESLTHCGSSLPTQDRTELDALILQSQKDARSPQQ